MQIKTTETIEKMVEIETPYYFRCNFDHFATYGKILENYVVTIDIPHNYNNVVEWSLEVDKNVPDISWVEGTQKISESEWSQAVQEFLEGLNNALV